MQSAYHFRKLTQREYLLPKIPAKCGYRHGPDLGRLLENCIFMELCRRQARITYLITSSGHEVDFVAEHPDNRVEAIQVSSDISAPETRKRETRALLEAGREIPEADLLLITINEEEARDTSPFRIIPAWKWLIKSD